MSKVSLILRKYALDWTLNKVSCMFLKIGMVGGTDFFKNTLWKLPLHHLWVSLLHFFTNRSDEIQSLCYFFWLQIVFFYLLLIQLFNDRKKLFFSFNILLVHYKIVLLIHKDVQEQSKNFEDKPLVFKFILIFEWLQNTIRQHI